MNGARQTYSRSNLLSADLDCSLASSMRFSSSVITRIASSASFFFIASILAFFFLVFNGPIDPPFFSRAKAIYYPMPLFALGVESEPSVLVFRRYCRLCIKPSPYVKLVDSLAYCFLRASSSLRSCSYLDSSLMSQLSLVAKLSSERSSSYWTWIFDRDLPKSPKVVRS